MLDILHAELEELGAFNAPLPDYFQKLLSINYFNIPDRMKAIIAVNEVTALATQFKRNIRLPDGALVPTNSINFCIAASGGQKDSSLRLARRAFTSSYDKLDVIREQHAKQKAIQAAKEAGEDAAEEKAIYEAYYTPPVSTFLKEVTPQGFIQYLNDISQEDLGAGVITNSELADEFNTNPNFADVIKVISESYDLGVVEATYTKGKEFRNSGVSGIAVTAMFIGSHYMIMYNESIKTKFINSFMSKLGRRGSFAYLAEKTERETEASGLELVTKKRELRDKAKHAAAALSVEIEAVTDYGIKTNNQELSLTKEADTMFLLLQEYDTERALAVCGAESADNLYTTHRYWRALKLAGALAIFDKTSEITVKHLSQAITITDYFANDMRDFELDLSKAPHERLSDYLQTLVTSEHKALISIHDIKKHGFSSSVTRAKLLELAKLCAGYDESGVYSVVNEDSAIQYEQIIKSTVLGLSYKPIDNTELNKAVASGNKEAIDRAKHKISTTTAYGFEVEDDISFADLGELLEHDFAYSPFVFRNGVRGKDNIIGGTKWLVLDVDKSLTSATEAHFMLSDINHHIALSSDPNNDYKFRVLIELDAPVVLDSLAWKHFYLEIAKDLALVVDVLPQSQIFFSYADRPVLSVTDAEPLQVRNYVMLAKEKVTEKSAKETKVTSTQAKLMLADPLETFAYAYNAEDGSGSRSLIRAAYHAKDLGADLDYTVELIENINNYWVSPMPVDRTTKIINQVKRMF